MATRRDVEERINVRAAKDERFRAALLKNAHDTLKNEVGLELPEKVKINVVEESPTEYYIVLPPKHAGAGEPEASTGLLRLLGVARPTY